MGYTFRLAARVLLYASSHRQDNTYHGLCYTSRGALAGTTNSSMGTPWRIDLTTHRTMSEHSYHGATSLPKQLKVFPINVWVAPMCTVSTARSRCSGVSHSPPVVIFCHYGCDMLSKPLLYPTCTGYCVIHEARAFHLLTYFQQQKNTHPNKQPNVCFTLIKFQLVFQNFRKFYFIVVKLLFGLLYICVCVCVCVCVCDYLLVMNYEPWINSNCFKHSLISFLVLLFLSKHNSSKICKILLINY